MPKLLIDKPDELLVDVDPGKSKSAMKSGNVCSYYAENWLRERPKEIRNDETSPERLLEKFHSNVRKKISLSADIYSELRAIFNSFDRITTVELEQLKHAATMIDRSIIMNTPDFQENPHWPHVLTELNKYINLISKEKKSKTEILSQLSEERKGRDIYIFEEVFKKRKMTDREFFERYTSDKYSALHAMYQKIRREDYKLIPSRWIEKNSFDELLKQIRIKGPHLAAGFFGRHCYSEQPKESTLYTQKLFVFDDSSYRKNAEDKLLAHAIILVGGKRTAEGKKILYYRDPKDKHTAALPSPYYAIEFDAFPTKCLNWIGFNNSTYKTNETCLFFSSKYKNKDFVMNETFAINHYNSTLQYGPENFRKR